MQVFQSVDHQFRASASEFFVNVSGGPYALRLWDLHLAEPLTSFIAVLQNISEPAAWTWIMIISLGLPLLLAFFLGRFYCGYVCPVSMLTALHQKLRFGSSIRTPVIKKNLPDFFWLGFLALLLLYPQVVQYLLPPALLQHAISDWILFGGVSLWLLLLGVF